MNEREDAKVSELYRALGSEEPPVALDAAILAAARRAVGARPRAARQALQRWALPVSVAAVVVLSVTITLQMQRERPDATALYSPEPKKIEQSAAREAPTAAAPSASAAPRPESRKEQAGAVNPGLAKQNMSLEADRLSKPAAARQERSADETRPAQAPSPAGPQFAPDPAASAAPPLAESPSPATTGAVADRAAAPAESELARRRTEESAASGRASSGALVRSAPASVEMRAKSAEKDESPERWLERIVQLRVAGREREADESFAEFRKRYPDYRISEEMLGKLGGKR